MWSLRVIVRRGLRAGKERERRIERSVLDSFQVLLRKLVHRGVTLMKMSNRGGSQRFGI